MALWSLFETARTTDGLPGTFLRLLVMVIVSCLRYTHLRRVVDVKRSSALVSGVVSKGKRLVKGSRPPFPWAICTKPILDLDLTPDLELLSSDGMREAGLLPGILSPTRGSVDSHSKWLTQPMTYAQLTYLFRSGLAASSAPQPTATFNSLRRVMPTMGNCLGLADEDMQSISNWQEVVKAPGGSHRAKASFPMGRHYAADKHESSAWLKGRMLEAFRVMALRRLDKLRDRAPSSSSARIMPAGSWTWSDLREEVQAHASSYAELPELPLIPTSAPGQALEASAPAIQETRASTG